MAYEHWLANPYLVMSDLGDKFGVSPESIRHFVKTRGLKRPDGKGFRPATSERKDAIVNAYNLARKEGKDINWAVTKANEGRANRSVNKGDLVYYAVKNDLPELPHPPAYRIQVLPR